MAESKIKISIGSKADLSGFAKVKSALSNVASKVKGFAVKIGSNLMNIKAGFDMLTGAVRTVGGWLQKALDAETMTMQFKTLMGSIDEARQHMEMLRELGQTPPFSMEQFAEASRAMMVLSEGALGGRASLELIGDAAAATGKPIEQVGEAVAKAYAMIQDGQPLSRTAAMLRSLGVITPEVAAELVSLQDAGASGVEIWDKLETAISKFNGAMADTEETGNGMIGAIQSQWDEGLRDFGEALWDVGRVYIKELLDWLRKIREDGSLQTFIDKFAKFTKSIIDGIGKCVDAFKSVKGWLTETFSVVGDVIGAMATGASFSEAVDQAADNMNQRAKERQMDAEIDAENKAKAKAAAEQRAEEKRVAAEKEKEDEKRRQREAIAAKDAEREKQKKIADEQKQFEDLEAEEAGYAQEMIDRKDKEQKEAEKKRVAALKDTAKKEEATAKDVHKKKMQLLDKEIAKIEKQKRLFDSTLNAGMNAEASRRWDGQSKVQLGNDGMPASVRDWERAQRFAEAGTEDEAKAMHRAKSDERRAERIMRQLGSGQQLSKSDARFMQSRQAMMAKRNADERVKKLQEEKDKAVVNLDKTVTKIRTDLAKALSVK